MYEPDAGVHTIFLVNSGCSPLRSDWETRFTTKQNHMAKTEKAAPKTTTKTAPAAAKTPAKPAVAEKAVAAKPAKAPAKREAVKA